MPPQGLHNNIFLIDNRFPSQHTTTPLAICTNDKALSPKGGEQKGNTRGRIRKPITGSVPRVSGDGLS